MIRLEEGKKRKEIKIKIQILFCYLNADKIFNYSIIHRNHCFNTILLLESKENELKSYKMHNPLSEKLAIFIERKTFPIRLNKIKNVDTKSTSFSAFFPSPFPISLFTQFLIAPVNKRDIKSQFRQTGGGNKEERRRRRRRPRLGVGASVPE